MNEFIEKLIGRLEKLQQSQIEKYTKSLDEGNLSCIYDKTDIEDAKVRAIWKSLEIVTGLAEEYNGGWIDCSERLPEVNGKYLVCVSNPTRARKNCIFTFWYNEYDKEFIREHDLDYVIAWQPLPEPYQLKAEINKGGNESGKEQ